MHFINVVTMHNKVEPVVIQKMLTKYEIKIIYVLEMKEMSVCIYGDY